MSSGHLEGISPGGGVQKQRQGRWNRRSWRRRGVQRGGVIGQGTGQGDVGGNFVLGNGEGEYTENSQRNTGNSRPNYDRGKRRGNKRGGGGGRGGGNQQLQQDPPDIERHQVPVTLIRIDDNEVLQYLVNDHNGSCSLSDIRENSDLFQTDVTPDQVLHSLKQCRNLSVLTDPRNLDSSVVKAFLMQLRMCGRYVLPKPCSRQYCPYLHLCRDFVMDCCFARKCQLDHDVDSAHNEKITMECGVQIFSQEQQLSLIRCSNLMVCPEHNSDSGCPNPDACFKLHICNYYAQGKCLIPGRRCVQGHDLSTNRNRKILNLYRMGGFEEKLVLDLLLKFRKNPLPRGAALTEAQPPLRESPVEGWVEVPHNGDIPIQISPSGDAIDRSEETEHPSENQTEDVPVDSKLEGVNADSSQSNANGKAVKDLMSFSDWTKRHYNVVSVRPDESHDDVCKDFEEHECNQNRKCTDRHKSRTPYLWRLKMNGQWTALDGSESVEKAFCDPDRDEFWDTILQPDTGVCINFTRMTSDAGRVQRLTTASYTECKNENDATRWTWYWNDGRSWIPYGQSDLPPYQDVLEAKYQRDRHLTVCFEIKNFLYELNFKEMEQINLQTKMKRRVQRRPIYKEKVGWNTGKSSTTKYHFDIKKLPPGWVPMDTESKDGTELVPLCSTSPTYASIKHKFFSTLNERDFEIRRIYRVQNLELWQSYQMKKTSLDQQHDSESEVEVYHGTAQEDTVRWICGIGFDQRMHGVNGTAYGKGAYFATTAKYSHGYTTPSSRNLRYMFCARITVGKVARGSPEYKRPPAIDLNRPNKGLHDACVDNVSNPSIYVIFDNNQSYPEYLIEYQDLANGLGTGASSQPYYGAFGTGASSQPYYGAFGTGASSTAYPTQSSHTASSAGHSAPSSSSTNATPSVPTAAATTAGIGGRAVAAGIGGRAAAAGIGGRATAAGIGGGGAAAAASPSVPSSHSSQPRCIVM